ncbi:MAG: hypothetical protein XE02_1351, partial [Mesotoga infera]
SFLIVKRIYLTQKEFLLQETDTEIVDHSTIYLLEVDQWVNSFFPEKRFSPPSKKP